MAAAAFPACPRLCWAAPSAPCLFQASSPSWRFYFLNLRTAGSLVLPSQSVYSAAGFRKSALVPLPAHSFPPSSAELLQRDSASFCSHQDPALGSSKCSPAEKSSSFHFVQSWPSPSCLLCGFVGGVSDVPLILRGAAERTGRAKGVFLSLSGWMESAFSRISDFGTVNTARAGSLLHLNKTISIRPLLSCRALAGLCLQACLQLMLWSAT